MKRYILAIVCCVMAIMTYAECTTLTGSSVEISRWYDFYTPVIGGEMDCWTVELEGEGPYQIRYNIDLDQFEGDDQVCIYEIKNDGSLELLQTFSAVTMSGAIVTYSNKLRVEYYGFTGKLTEEFFDGFQLYFEIASHEYVAIHDYYVLGRLGVGTTSPQATLHVNGGIYGGESFGATLLQSTIGHVTIGTASDERKNMQFTTDRSQFRFNKPLLSQVGEFGSTTNSLQLTTNDSVCMTIQNGNVGIGTMTPQEKLHVNGAIRGDGVNGQVTLKGDSGYVTIGATSQAMEFVTNKSQFVFNKPIYNQSGIYNVRNSNLIFNINDTTRMTILHSSGNVGIGILNPTTRLHINDGALKIGLSTSASERLKNILQFGDGTYVQMGEWEKDDYLSFKASGYNFTKGNVGIGTLTPAYKLDVAGTIRAQELIVETTGADFVFAEDYQLRPLSEVKAFIEENKHLPEIKSAQEMQENGVSVSELQIQLLQKIEELTLYLIQQEQTIQELRQEIELFKK